MIEEDTYEIRRFYSNEPYDVIAFGLTLDEAQAHCNDPATSSICGTAEHHPEYGCWFDDYVKERKA